MEEEGFTFILKKNPNGSSALRSGKQTAAVGASKSRGEA